jgi:hypothetical protein
MWLLRILRKTGTPITGTPITGTPITGTPITGTPITGTPITGTPMATNSDSSIWQPPCLQRHEDEPA